MVKLLDKLSGHPDGWEGFKEAAGVNTEPGSSDRHIPESDEVRNQRALEFSDSAGVVSSNDRYLGRTATGGAVELQGDSSHIEVTTPEGDTGEAIDVRTDSDLPPAPEA